MYVLQPMIIACLASQTKQDKEKEWEEIYFCAMALAIYSTLMAFGFSLIWSVNFGAILECVGSIRHICNNSLTKAVWQIS